MRCIYIYGKNCLYGTLPDTLPGALPGLYAPQSSAMSFGTVVIS